MLLSIWITAFPWKQYICNISKWKVFFHVPSTWEFYVPVPVYVAEHEVRTAQGCFPPLAGSCFGTELVRIRKRRGKGKLQSWGTRRGHKDPKISETLTDIRHAVSLLLFWNLWKVGSSSLIVQAEMCCTVFLQSDYFSRGRYDLLRGKSPSPYLSPLKNKSRKLDSPHPAPRRLACLTQMALPGLATAIRHTSMHGVHFSICCLTRCSLVIIRKFNPFFFRTKRRKNPTGLFSQADTKILFTALFF